MMTTRLIRTISGGRLSDDVGPPRGSLDTLTLSPEQAKALDAQQASQVPAPTPMVDQVNRTKPPPVLVQQTVCPACPKSKWYIFVLLGGIAGGLATATGFLINDAQKKRRR